MDYRLLVKGLFPYHKIGDVHQKVYGYVLPCNGLQPISKGLLDYYNPPKVHSSHYKHWAAQLDLKTCFLCRNKHGEIYNADEMPMEKPPVHPNCRCVIDAMDAVFAGQGTKDGENGADWWIKNYGYLPNYYISVDDLTALGWKWGKSPAKFSPGKMPTMGIYQNKNGHLPQVPGRIWYEADINYYSGKRNGHRLLWSNDGLLFATYDHYTTFLEII